MLQLRWIANGGERHTKSERSQRGDRRRPAKPPPMVKLVSQESSSKYLGIKSQKSSYPPRVQTGPLYKDPRDGYLSK